ncbi:Uncharacterised protein [Segatella copri]|nr:Uncharacterised protein [Segatella copri]
MASSQTCLILLFISFFLFSVQRYEDFTIYNKVKQDYFASVMFQ